MGVVQAKIRPRFNLKVPTSQAGRAFITIALMAAATVLQWFLWPVISKAPFILYYPAVLLAALYGNGWLAIPFSSLIAQYLFVAPMFSFEISWPQGVATQILFLLSSLMIVAVSKAFLQTKAQAEQAAREVRLYSEWLRATLISIGDAVIATDSEGNVTFMNRVAENLTGWSHSEAQSQHLDAVFPIVNETTRQKVESPVSKVIRVGHIVGLANHTALIRKDGTEVVIEDSAAPIRNEQGELTGVVLVFRDASEKRKVDARLSFERHQLETIFEHSPAAMALWTGPDFVFEKVNSQYQAIFPGRQLQGKPFLEACPEFKDQPFQSLLTKVLETGEPFVGKEILARHPRHEGGPLEDVYYDFTYMRVTDPDGRPYGVYDHAIDVTDKVEAKLKLIDALRARDELLSVCSHELRTPVASMKLSTQMFQRGLKKGDPKMTSMDRVRRMVDQADRQLEKLTRLIEEMLDFSRISGGRLQLNPETFDLSELVSETLERMRAQFEAVGSIVSFEKSVPAVGKWDRFRLEQVITNLLSNALKYGDKKPVQVDLRQTANGAVLRVSDQGFGISPEDHHRIFKPYERAVSVNNISGLGLGLYISHQIIEAHGGRITVASAPGQGATFTIVLPLEGEKSS